jgi:hypothetical protein
VSIYMEWPLRLGVMGEGSVGVLDDVSAAYVIRAPTSTWPS